MRAQGTNGTRPAGASDRDIWRRGQAADAVPDEADYLMDLAAFADRRLDPDETARIEALIARDGEAAADIAAARSLAGTSLTAADPAVIARAEALIGDDDLPQAALIAFPATRPAMRPTAVRPWYSAASWSGLAAAMVLAGWLGFDLGSGLSASPVFGRSSEDVSVSELLDATPLVVHDFTESSQI